MRISDWSSDVCSSDLADNLIDLKSAELLTDWCADILDAGGRGSQESSMAKVAVSEALYRVADRSVQILGGLGVTRSEERRVGKECVSTCSSRLSPDH